MNITGEVTASGTRLISRMLEHSFPVYVTF